MGSRRQTGECAKGLFSGSYDEDSSTEPCGDEGHQVGAEITNHGLGIYLFQVEPLPQEQNGSN